MATTRRTFRSGTTTVNVNVPRSSASSTRRRPSTAGRPRTVKQVASLSSRRSDNTPLYVGAAALGAAALYLLWPGGGEGTARADDVTPLPPSPVTPGVFPQQGSTLGYAGPGSYRVTAQSGLKIRSAPNTGGTMLSGPGSQVSGAGEPYWPTGSAFQIAEVASNGWVRVTSPVNGFTCLSCAEGGSGAPFAVRTA